MKSSAVVAGLVAAASAARPANESICDYYTTALLKNNTAANQATLLTLVVNTAVIGNYTTPNVGVAVPGILTPGEYKGTKVNLLPYFDGALASTNNGGSSGQSVNFLDGGAAVPLMHNLPANNTSSNQYTLLTHLYEYFGDLLGCSMFSNTTTPYAGQTSMYAVHKYMGIDEAEIGYFITQVGLSAASFGVAASDVTAVGEALFDAFGYRCSPPASIPASASPALQAICIASDCPIATKSADCSAYAPVVEPTPVSSMSSMSASMNSTVVPTMYSTSTGAPTSYMTTWTSSGMTYTSSVMTTPMSTYPVMTTPAMTSPVSTMTPPPYVAGAANVLPGGVLAAIGLVAALA